MSERYVDPNSGAAPQPGGFAMGQVAKDEPQEEPEQQLDSTEPDSTEQPEQPDSTDSTEQPEQPAEPRTEEPEEPEEPAEPEEPTEPEPEEKDYSELLEKNLGDVEAYIQEHPDEKDAVVAAERKREKPRRGITEL